MQLAQISEEIKFLVLADRESFSVFMDNFSGVEPMRKVSGAHKDISLVRVSIHLSMVVTATASGTIGLWDFELSTLCAILEGHSSPISEV